jgi:transketolase
MTRNDAFDAVALRQAVLDMAYAGQTVHIACAFSIIEILAVLYRNHLRYPGNRFDHEARDYLVLSKGHGVMAQYACLREKGWIESGELADYFKNGTRLRGLSEVHIPGVEVTSGSLGHGLSVGVGLALGAKRKGTDQMCYAIVGDGEANEGSIWEAVLFAAQFRLDNLVLIIDKNGFQAMGATADVMDLADMGSKLKAFGFDVVAVDGHDEDALHKVLLDLGALASGRPKAIVAHTVKGKGVSFMEGINLWHYTRLNAETYAAASHELAVTK